MKKAALISVSDRTGLIPFAQGLNKLGYVLLTTSGSGSYLKQHGIETSPIEQYTGQKEILDGRVKTLHPKIYAGILARRDNAADIAQIEVDGILPIDVVAVNLYPFEKYLSQAQDSSAGKSLHEMIELIDIGGPSMIRAAAKNHRFVYPVIDPADYGAVLSHLEQQGATSSMDGEALRRRLAAKVFAMLAQDNIAVGGYLAAVSDSQSDHAFPPYSGFVLRRSMQMRYGENPHQRGAYYLPVSSSRAGIGAWEQLGGKELSYNNMLDIDAAVRIIAGFQGGGNSGDTPARRADAAVVIIKHLNPCGAAFGSCLHDALLKAKRSDPRSHFGGIIGCSTNVTRDVADSIREDFAEIVVAPDFDDDALTVLRTSKNLRIIKIASNAISDQSAARRVEYRSCLGGMLVQETDACVSDPRSARVVTSRTPTDKEWGDITLAWRVCAHVKSNAIVVVKDGTLVGVGAGQMSRIDSVELAVSKARVHGHDLKGAVAASDAFFPFPDSIETLAQAGVKAVIAPSGARRDEESIEAANRLGVSLLFANDRHFRH